MSDVRVLVADDFEPFRQFIRSTLGKNPTFSVICEVSDGLEAVWKAAELKPDLILLDIGLPKLGGIEAARRIRELAPQSKVLFVSQMSSVDAVEAAFSVGASGYVVKMDAVRELTTAVKAVLRGERFVGSRFAGSGFIGAADARTPGSSRGNRVTAPRPRENTEITRRHEVGFYSEDTTLLDDLTHFIGTALQAGNAVIVLATESHRDSLLLRLQACGLDIFAAIEQGRYISLDAAATLSTFMNNDQVDPVQFFKLTGDLIRGAAKAVKGERARVSACGECSPLLWEQGKPEAAISLEHLWDEIAKSYDVDILCGYSVHNVRRGMDSQILQRICAEHSAVRSQ